MDALRLAADLGERRTGVFNYSVGARRSFWSACDGNGSNFRRGELFQLEHGLATAALPIFSQSRVSEESKLRQTTG